MTNGIKKPEDLNSDALAKLIMDMSHRLIVHHTLWYNEVSHQMGVEKAQKALEQVVEILMMERDIPLDVNIN